MRRTATAFATLSLIWITGCKGTSTPNTPVQTANIPQHSVNRYELHGSPDKIALLVDSETGTVWQFEDSGSQKKFVPVEVVRPDGLPTGAKVIQWEDLK